MPISAVNSHYVDIISTTQSGCSENHVDRLARDVEIWGSGRSTSPHADRQRWGCTAITHQPTHQEDRDVSVNPKEEIMSGRIGRGRNGRALYLDRHDVAPPKLRRNHS